MFNTLSLEVRGGGDFLLKYPVLHVLLTQERAEREAFTSAHVDIQELGV